MISARVQPIASHVFSGAEIWLILQQLGTVPPDAPAPAELASSADQLLQAEDSLLAQGYLHMSAEGARQLSPAIESIVRPAVFPDSACIVNIADVITHGEVARMACFSRAAETFVVNWVDDAQQHHFQAYAPEHAPTVAWEYLVQQCDLDTDAPSAPIVRDQSQIQRAMAEARQTVLLMLAKDIQSAEQRSSALSWFVSGRSIWLIERQGQTEQPPHPASTSDVSRAVKALIAQMDD